jgi:hypothetical protein
MEEENKKEKTIAELEAEAREELVEELEATENMVTYECLYVSDVPSITLKNSKRMLSYSTIPVLYSSTLPLEKPIKIIFGTEHIKNIPPGFSPLKFNVAEAWLKFRYINSGKESFRPVNVTSELFIFQKTIPYTDKEGRPREEKKLCFALKNDAGEYSELIGIFVFPEDEKEVKS